MTTRGPVLSKLRCCAGCAAMRLRPEGPCSECGSIQTILMGQGARSAVAEAYAGRKGPRSGTASGFSLSQEQRKAEMGLLFGKEGE